MPVYAFFYRVLLLRITLPGETGRALIAPSGSRGRQAPGDKETWWCLYGLGVVLCSSGWALAVR